MKCPVCRKSIGNYEWPSVEGKRPSVSPYPLYQVGYSSDDPEYVSPRCSECIDKIMKERADGKPH